MTAPRQLPEDLQARLDGILATTGLRRYPKLRDRIAALVADAYERLPRSALTADQQDLLDALAARPFGDAVPNPNRDGVL